MAALGFLDGLGDALVSISTAISGYLSDRLKKRKIFVWTEYFLSALSRIGYSLSTIWPHLIPFKIIDQTKKIRSAPRDAIITNISTDKNRRKNFSFLRTMDHLKTIFKIIIYIIFFKILKYKILFAIATIPSLISALLIFLFIKEKKSKKIKIYRGITLKDLDRNFKFFLILSSIFSLETFNYSFLLIYAKNFGFKVGFVPVLYLIYTASASLFSLPFKKLSNKIGRKSVLMLSFLL